MKAVLFVLLALVFAASVSAQEPLGFEDDWTSVLQRIVQDDGLVAYDEAAGPDFDRTLAAIASFDPSRLTTDDEKLAFWINAYNARMVEAIAARPDARNLEKQGLFDALFKSPVTVAGREVTLDQIEHVILRRQDGPAALEALAVGEVTPLIHVGLNCAAVSCPQLRDTAFYPGRVRRQLRNAFSRWVMLSDERNKASLAYLDGETLVLSSLLDWFGEDFDQPDKPAGDLINSVGANQPGGSLGVMCGNDQRYPLAARIAELKGKTAAEIKAMPNVRFEYDWTVARAK
jgi:hypothetical protein